ncbi:MAG: helix-turn-helix transcriptional regulator [Clostridiales bacterium]|nr:helix-turn-helix transcriptional regulator [Clostridiales bacterium]
MDKEKKEFAKRLKQIMQEKNITAYGLAKMSGLSRQLISNYLHGRSFPKSEQLEKIAASLNVNIFSLLTDIPINKKILDTMQETFLKLPNVQNITNYVLDFIKANVANNTMLDKMVKLPVLRFCSCVF